MTKFSFYVSSSNSSNGLYKLLPSLLEKMLMKNHKVLIACNTPQVVKYVDDLLWRFQPTKFLPHGINSEEKAANQPILITSESENLNHADILITFSGKEVKKVSSFVQVFDIFESSQEQLDSGRERWKEYKKKGYELSYFTSEEGRWIKKM